MSKLLYCLEVEICKGRYEQRIFNSPADMEKFKPIYEKEGLVIKEIMIIIEGEV